MVKKYLPLIVLIALLSYMFFYLAPIAYVQETAEQITEQAAIPIDSSQDEIVETFEAMKERMKARGCAEGNYEISKTETQIIINMTCTKLASI